MRLPEVTVRRALQDLQALKVLQDSEDQESLLANDVGISSRKVSGGVWWFTDDACNLLVEAGIL